MNRLSLLCLLILALCQPSFSQIDNLLSFDNQNTISKLKIEGVITSVSICTDNRFWKDNRPTLALSLSAVSKDKRGISITYTPDQLPNLSKYKALRFWVYLPSENNNQTKVTENIRIFINQRFSSGSGDFELKENYLKTGWNLVRYDFGSNMTELTELKFLTINIGMNQYFSQGNIYIGPVDLEKMDAINARTIEELDNILSDKSSIKNQAYKIRKNGEPSPASTRDQSWALRYQAIVKLQATNNEDVVPILLDACSSEVAIIRNKARQAIVSMGKVAVPKLKKELSDNSCMIRQAAAEMLGEIGLEKCAPAVVAELEETMLDPNFYVRNAAIKSLQSFGKSNAEIVAVILPYLAPKAKTSQRIIAAQALSEMTVMPGLYNEAQKAVASLLTIAQNSKEDYDLRIKALSAAWKLNEDTIPLTLWLLPLQGEPGDGHRHTYNKAMAALERAGTNALPILREALRSDNPVLKTRVASVLMAMGPKAIAARPELEACLTDKQWYVRWQALKTLENMGITPQTVPDVNNPAQAKSSKISVKEDANELITIDNGNIELIFSKRSNEDGPIELRRNGLSTNLIQGSGYTHWLCEKPLGKLAEVKVKSNDDYADVSFFHPSDDKAVVDFTMHYIIRRGESGFYTFITVTKTPDKPDMVIGFFDYLLRAQSGIFKTIVFHDKFQGPSFSMDTQTEEETKQMKDIFQATYRLPNGEINAKHEWHNHEYISSVSGAYGKNIGIWAIHPSWDYFGAAFPNCIRMMDAGAYLISALDNKYYFHGGCVVTGAFEKVYGPFYTYLNTGENGTEMWTDAKRKSEIEVAQWPYKWVENKGYHERSTVKGRIALSNGKSTDSTWIILSHPDSAFGWQRDIGPYMFWVRTKADGSFEIPNVRAGRYTLFANKEGIWGEFQKDNIEVTPNQNVDLGNLSWTEAESGKLLWQIGIPNRTSKEFYNGRNFGQWDNFITYRACFPNDVDFVVGKSDYRHDWNYVHPSTAMPAESKATPWKIRFKLDKIPEGNLKLTIAISSTRQSFLSVLVNDSKIARYSYPYNKEDDSAGIRTAAYGLYSCHSEIISKDLLKTGENIIILNQTYLNVWSYVMYDCIKLEEVKN